MIEASVLPAKQRVLTLDIWQTITAIAPEMFKSGLFGVRSQAQAATIMVKGYELGLTLSASFEFIQVIQGKPGLSPRGMLALIHGHPELARMEINDYEDDEGNPSYCSAYMKRKNGFEYTAEFSMADAERAKLLKADSGWEKYPDNMLRWRAVGFCADVVFPDVLGGMKRTDELGADVTPEGDTIEGSWEEVISPKVQKPRKSAGTKQKTKKQKIERPADPETVKDWMTQKALKGSEAEIRNKQVGMVVRSLEGLFHMDSADMRQAKRYSLLRFFFAKDSAKLLTASEASALISWSVDMIEHPDGQHEFLPSELAIQEAAKIIELLDKEAGQQEMLLSEESEEENIPI